MISPVRLYYLFYAPPNILTIVDSWSTIVAIANMNTFMMNYVGFWGRTDPDMLEVGNGDLTMEENRAHFALWAIMKSPLMLGTAVS